MDNQELVKNALSFSLGALLHESWRSTRKCDDGSFNPRIKKSKDEVWNLQHGTDEVDIANCLFEQLPSNWQYENLEAAKVAINLVFDKVISGKMISLSEIEIMVDVVHKEWLKRNEWVYDINYGDPKLAVSFEQLSKEEQDKDIIQIKEAIVKVLDYINGKIIIEDICKQYGLSSLNKTK